MTYVKNQLFTNWKKRQNSVCKDKSEASKKIMIIIFFGKILVHVVLFRPIKPWIFTKKNIMKVLGKTVKK